MQIAAELAAPLGKTKEIVMIGGNDRTTAEVSRLAGTLPPAIQALTGVDLSQVRIINITIYTIDISMCSLNLDYYKYPKLHY